MSPDLSLVGNGTSGYPSLSWDGRFVSFDSFATNLIDPDDSSVQDAFVHDVLLGTTARVSVAPDGTQLNGSSLNAVLSGSATGSGSPTRSATSSCCTFGSAADVPATGTARTRPDPSGSGR